MSSAILTLDSILHSFSNLIMGSSESRDSNSELPEPNEQNCINFYYGRIETITSKRSAVVCIAHRNSITLKWDDNWCEPGVTLERVLLLAKNLRTSNDETEKYLVQPLQEVLVIGEPVKVSIQANYSKTPDKCYKWFAKFCWKVDVNGVICKTPMNLLQGHMYGLIESVNNQYGIINFKTYVGTSEKAFFNRGSLILKRNKDARNHVSLENIVNVGTEVFLVVNRWWTVGNNSDFDQILLEKNVHFKAVQVWTKKSNGDIENRPVVKQVNDLLVEHHVRKGAVGKNSPSVGEGSLNFDSRLKKKYTKEIGADLKCANTNSLEGAISGTLMSFDEDWGMIQVGDEMITFDICPAFLYGLKLEDIPLHRIFFSDQVVRVFMQKGKVIKLEYGSPQLGESRRKAILTYCEKNYVPNDIRGKLGVLMERQT